VGAAGRPRGGAEDPAAAKPSFVAPSGGGVLAFSLTATDADGATATDLVVVTVTSANQRPVASAGADQDVLPCAYVDDLRLDEEASDPDGDGLPGIDDERLLHGTDPYRFDSDGDGHGDGAEVAAGSDPLDPASTP
jgi:hypothetical protein